MIYIVVGGEYSDWWIDSYFTDREKAEKYIVTKNKNGNNSENLYIEEVNENKSKLDYDKIVVKRHYTIVFDLKDNLWIIRDDPQRYEVYTGERKPTTSEVWHLNDNIWVISVTSKNYEEAKKVAFDKIAEINIKETK